MNTNPNNVTVWMNLLKIDIIRSVINVWENKVVTI